MLKAHLLENTILCYLMQGTPTKATDDVRDLTGEGGGGGHSLYSSYPALHGQKAGYDVCYQSRAYVSVYVCVCVCVCVLPYQHWW